MITLSIYAKRPAGFGLLLPLLLFGAIQVGGSASAQKNLIANPGFEAGRNAGTPEGWDPFWARDAGAGEYAPDRNVKAGRRAIIITHRGTKDWSVAQTAHLPVHPGEIYSIGAHVKCDQGNVVISVVTRRADGETIDWAYGSQDAGGKHDWKEYSRKFVVPPDCATVQYRVIGDGPVAAWLADARLVRVGSIAEFRGTHTQKRLTMQNALLNVQVETETGLLTVTDKRIRQTWQQKSIHPEMLVKRAEQTTARSVRLLLYDVANDLDLQATLELSTSKAELSIALAGNGPVRETIAYPHPFVTSKESWLVVPMNEGILYPAGDESIYPMQLITYSGHGICMPWWGVTNRVDTAGGKTPDAGYMAIVHTPDDARVDINRPSEHAPLLLQMLWEPSRSQFRYTRKLTYVFFHKGGYVAQAKRYREYAKQTGLFKTLAQKRRENPNIDRLVGAANIWNWDMGKVALCEEMKAAGMDHILWSSGGSAQELKAINGLGYLSSRYDIFQDVWPPNAPSYLMKAGWPEDLVWLPNGEWMHGWADIQHNKDGTTTTYQGGVISSPRGLARAHKTIPEDLKANPYLCRFIDTTTASPFREDYNPAHPLTRSDDRKYKMELLKFCADDCKLVVGTETGIDPSVPYADYYEGMMSLGPYRLPDAGYDMIAYRKPTPEFLKFMVGHYYRVPLWELVYHECVVAQWYWGDSNNKAPEVWDRRDLFNILYSTPPLYMFSKETWQNSKAKFVSSYKAICPVVRKFGYDEMVSHSFLTPDHSVQTTRWRSGKQIVVNFGDSEYALPDGKKLAAMSWLVR